MNKKKILTKIHELNILINKFWKENQMNKKILFWILVFIVVLLWANSYLYWLLYSAIFFILFIKPLREVIYRYFNLIEPTIYFLFRKYTSVNISSLYSSSIAIYQKISIILILILGAVILMNFDNLLLSFYQGELQKEIWDKLIIWLKIASWFMLFGNFIKLFWLFIKLVLNWVFIIFYVIFTILLNIENSIYFNVIISLITPLLTMTMIFIFLYRPIYTDYSVKYNYFNLWYKESKNDWKKFNSFLNSQLRKEPNNIAIILDNPILYKSDDLFWHKNIADNAYNLIRWINVDSWSYSIGLIWEWWLWKSSIIGILKESKLKLDSNIILHEFNPWNYTKSDLINSFITEIATKVNKRDLTKLLIKYTELLSWINSTAWAIIKLVKSLFWNEKTIDEIRKQIGEELGKTDKKLVVIIDDLDRCEPEEIITMLNVVKNIGNFSHVIYLISFDKLHIIEALNTKWFHEDYIEKIINTEIHVPLPDKETKANYFSQKFTEILWEVWFREDWIKESCENIINTWTSWLDEIFEKENLRLIKKLLNKLNVNFKLVYNSNNKRCELLSKEDIANIVLINYIKIKHLDFYNDAIKKRNMMSPDTFFYKSPNRPPMYLNMKERRLEQLFLDNIAWLNIAIWENDTLQIFNQNTLKNVPDLAHKINYLNKNWWLLREFS